VGIKQQRLVSGGPALAEKVLAAFKNVWHFNEVVDTVDPRKTPQYIVNTITIGEDIARNVIPGLPKEMNITNRFLYDVYKEAMDKVKV
jgi:hypothetical protein